MAEFIPAALKRFRVSIISGTIAAFLLTVVFTALGGIMLHGFTATLSNWRNLFSTYAFVSLPLSFVVSLMLTRLNPVAFSNEGIYGYSVRGIKIFLPWEDILQVRRFRFINLTYLRLYSKAHKEVLWLPLFQSHPNEFAREIASLAPPDSPIRNHLKWKNT